MKFVSGLFALIAISVAITDSVTAGGAGKTQNLFVDKSEMISDLIQSWKSSVFN